MDDWGSSYEFGESLDATGGTYTYSFSGSNGGFIGVYGTYSEMLNEFGPYSSKLYCTCSETQLISQSLENMIISINSGSTAAQTIPVFADTHEQ